MGQDQQTPDEGHETVNRESHPNASGPEGLAGDMGLSSERHGPFEGIEGTGSQASAQHATDGESPTVVRDEEPDDPQDPAGSPAIEGQAAPDKPDETSPLTNVDKTVGEVQPDPVTNKPVFDPSRNPRH